MDTQLKSSFWNR